jgi:hypothetical protein
MDKEAWLQGLGLERYVPAFRENEIDAPAANSATISPPCIFIWRKIWRKYASGQRDFCQLFVVANIAGQPVLRRKINHAQQICPSFAGCRRAVRDYPFRRMPSSGMVANDDHVLQNN